MASPGFTSYSVDNDRLFHAALRKARRLVSDLSVPLNLISRDFFRSQKAIWQLKGPGQYPDLAPSTKNDKRRDGYSIYPILKRTGRLQDAASNPGSPGNINVILGKAELVMGVKGTVIPYAIFHQSDEARRKLPLRKYLFIGPEAKRFATSDQAGRLNRWTNIINGYVLEMVEAIGDVA